LVTTLRKASAAAQVNRAAVQSIVLDGTCLVETRTRKAGAGGPAAGGPAPDRRSGVFRYCAADSGQLMRSDYARGGPPNAAMEWHRSFVNGLVLDAAEADSGYLRRASEFLLANSDNLEFYRDHWSDSLGPTTLGDLVAVATEHPRRFALATDPGDRRIDVMSDDGRPTGLSVTFDRDTSLVKEMRWAAGASHRWEWSRDRASGAYVIAKKTSVYPLVLPNGDVREEVITLEVRQARVNVPVPAAEFTFAELGLKPGARVYDMRATPPVKYRFDPSAPPVGAPAEGLVPAK
jgi:hypothetical protein